MKTIKPFLVTTIMCMGLFSPITTVAAQNDYGDPKDSKSSSTDYSGPKNLILLVPSTPIRLEGQAQYQYPGFRDNLEVVSKDYKPLEPLPENIFKQCGVLPKGDEKFAPAAVLPALIGLFAKVFIQNAFTTAEAELTQKLQKYQASYQASLAINLAHTQCVRFVRGTSENDKFTRNLDLVVKFETPADKSMMQMKVIHINTGKAEAKGKTKVSYAVSAQFNGFYIDRNNLGQTIKYDEQVFHTGKYGTDIPSEPCVIKTINDFDPCRPVFAYPGLRSANGISQLTIKVTEVGYDKRKEQLKKWRKLLGQVKGGVSTTLSGAIAELLK